MFIFMLQFYLNKKLKTNKMINKLLVFTENKETRIVRTYADTYTDDEIKEIILLEKDSNIIGDIIFKKFDDIYFCLVVKNENELYALGLINTLVETLNYKFPNLTDINFVYQFKEIYDIIDSMFVGGYVIQ